MHTRKTNKNSEAFSSAVDRPAFCTNEHLSFLDDLRESGVTNMFGARAYIEDEFPEMEGEKAASILGYWMKSFGNQNR